MTTRAITLAVLITGALLWVIWDVVAAVNSIRGDTISEITLSTALTHPILMPLFFGLALGVLLGHLFWSQKVDQFGRPL